MSDQTNPSDAEAASKAERSAGVKRTLTGQEPPEDTVQPLSPQASDDVPTAPEGVGESFGRHGEDVAKKEQEGGRQDKETQGSTDRPAGTSDGRDRSAVDPQG